MTVGTVTAKRNAERPPLGSVCELSRVDDRAGGRVRGVDQRRLAGDGDGFLQLADLERDVEGDELLRADANAAVLVGLEPGERRLDGVGAGRDRGEVVFALVVGDRLADVAVASLTNSP